jgi:hypothetical protein
MSEVIALNRPMQSEMAHVIESCESRFLKPWTISSEGLSIDSLIMGHLVFAMDSL